MKRAFSLCSTLIFGAVLVSACGRDRINAVQDGGVPLPTSNCLDSDGDGVPGTGSCSGESLIDCDDTNPGVYPGSPELCNGIDDNCNGQIDEGLTVSSYYLDADHDGIGGNKVGEGCHPPPAGAVTVTGDCNDSNAAIRPGTAELCNGLDDDCDGNIDNGLPFQDFYSDVDGDGFGDANSTPVSSCASMVTGKVPNRSDCNDNNSSIKPGATETCNKLDDNCDGQVDNGIAFTNYYLDGDGDGYGAANGMPEAACAPVSGKVANNQDCNDGTPMIKPGAAEICNGQDDNCNGQVDENLPFANYFPDIDGDGFGSSTATAVSACSPIAGKVSNNTDCNDGDATAKPGAPEVCNGRDDNCNGQADEGLTVTPYFADADGDGYGTGSAQNSCAPIAGKVTNNSDCNDADATIKPGAPERCNGIDDNCNGAPDEGLTFTNYYVDGDGDGFGAGTATSACQPITGKVANNTDCDDTKAAVKPGATEVCNGVDDNCNSSIDEGLTFLNYYVDQDGDGHGAGTAVNRCSQPAGRVLSNDDCNDLVATTYPGAPELCNGIDDNCNSTIDDGTSSQNFYLDGDNDGYGAGAAVSSCVPVTGRVTNNTDCDDTVAAVHPNATEICNGIDDNCNSVTDEGFSVLSYYADGDGDGFGAGTAQVSCLAVAGKVTNNTDCNDSSAAIHPGVTEICNAVDDNCNTTIDEGLPTNNFYKDTDGDGFGAGAAIPSCFPTVTGRVTNNTDCNDGVAAIHPGVTELCNNVDDNCNGATDEGNPGGGAACSTGQLGVCAAGVMTCGSGSVTCVRTTGPTTEKCDGLDNDCNGNADEPWPTKNQACTVGLGVCLKTGVNVCNSPGTGLQCSVSAGPPTAAACDGLDNDCDGIVDEPVFTATTDIPTAAWNDIEVGPFYYSAGAGGCAGGANGSGTDVLAGGALAMANGSTGISWQKLDTSGNPTGGVQNVTFLNYDDIAMAQAGAGYIIAGIWQNNHAEIDLYYVDAASGSTTTFTYTQFKTASTPTLDSLRVVRAGGNRVLVMWREAGAGIKMSRVQPTGCTASGCTGMTVFNPTPSVIAGSSSTVPGIALGDSFQSWAPSQSCLSTGALRFVGVSYLSSSTTLKGFYVNEDGSNKSSEFVITTQSSGQTMAEPEITYFIDGSSNSQFMTAWVTQDGPNAKTDLNYWVSSQTIPAPYQYAWINFATVNGASSITRPRLSVNASTNILLTANRWDIDASGFTRQIMTRVFDMNGAKVPTTSAVEISPASGSCGADPACRPGNKVGVTNWYVFNHVYYGATGSTPTGGYSSRLSCN